MYIRKKSIIGCVAKKNHNENVKLQLKIKFKKISFVIETRILTGM